MSQGLTILYFFEVRRVSLWTALIMPNPAACARIEAGSEAQPFSFGSSTETLIDPSELRLWRNTAAQKGRKASVIISESSYVIFLLPFFVHQSFCILNMSETETKLHDLHGPTRPGEATSKGEVVAKACRLSKGEERITDV